jgi:hypothetical protein
VLVRAQASQFLLLDMHWLFGVLGLLASILWSSPFVFLRLSVASYALESFHTTINMLKGFLLPQRF